jgi:hypothetical protein
MPRPKPDEPLSVRGVRMSDADFEAFNMLGGADWLRSRLKKLGASGIARRQRDSRIKTYHAAGMTDVQIAKIYKIDRATVWRIRA